MFMVYPVTTSFESWLYINTMYVFYYLSCRIESIVTNVMMVYAKIPMALLDNKYKCYVGIESYTMTYSGIIL